MSTVHRNAAWIGLCLLGQAWLLPAAQAETAQDARLEGAVQTALSLNRVLNTFAIKAHVDGQAATLTGDVENDVQRQLAQDVAQATRGIEQVDNQLHVNPQLVEQPLGLKAYAQRLEDATLTAIVRSRLAWSTLTQQAAVEVQAQDGVVTLRGKVDNPEAKALAGVLARSTEGVYLVNNLISLDSVAMAEARATPAQASKQAQPNDEWIVDKIQESFRFSRNLDVLKIKVASAEGMVRLSGEVVSAQQKSIAVEIARQILGVRGVDPDLLKVATKVEG
ncbi:BON domain-containing protein [Pseudomonas entomophila]|uniref:BON domain-containing protein n=1 Tax=Pseudomonas entomophila TaxID=312306 RepID=UPI0015E48428|nr:BON domain-containing protein [Pseudomonas entomophila]MBA1190360.1 BON domain-containing protein [Pseudomonas entomophila]